MEKDSPSKPSVAELAGRFKGHILPSPVAGEEPAFRRKTPWSPKLQKQRDELEDSDKIVPTSPVKVRMKNSSVIEKLQANLALSPTALLPPSKSPEGKLPPGPLSPAAPRSPPTPTPRPSQPSVEDEDPAVFADPPDGALLPSFNKTRARLSFKRRPPTRRHRRSAGEEAGDPKENGDQGVDEEAEAEPPDDPEGGEAERDGEQVGDCEETAREAEPEEKKQISMATEEAEEEGPPDSSLCPTERTASC